MAGSYFRQSKEKQKCFHKWLKQRLADDPVKQKDLHLCDVGESNNVRHNADACDEELSAFPEDVREFIDERGDEAFHGAELGRLQSHGDAALRNTPQQIWLISLCEEGRPSLSYLAVNSQHQQHGEEEYGPERRDGELSDSLRISQKGQARS